MSSVSFGRQDLTFAGNKIYTLTASPVASDPIGTKFVKKFSIYGYYTPGAGGSGNSVDYTVEINPFYPAEDPGNAFWAPIGRWVDTAGNYAEERATFIGGTATVAGVKYNLVPLDIVDPSAAQMRIKIEEVVLGGAAGSVQMMVGSNTIN